MPDVVAAPQSIALASPLLMAALHAARQCALPSWCLGARVSPRIRVRHPGTQGAGRGRSALLHAERAVSGSGRRSLCAPALRPGALADRWRPVDLRARRHAAAHRGVVRVAAAARTARAQVRQWLIAALNSVEVASLPWFILRFFADAPVAVAPASSVLMIFLRLNGSVGTALGRREEAQWRRGRGRRRSRPMCAARSNGTGGCCRRWASNSTDGGRR